MALNKLVETAARQVKQKIEEALPHRLLELRVFGSEARGEAGPDSDVDLFVLLDRRDMDSDDRVHRAVYEVYTQFDYELFLVPLIMSKQHFDDLLSRERRLAQDIMREGIVI